MPVSDFLQLQRAEVVANTTDAPRRILRLEFGAGLTCSYTATTNVITAELQATSQAGGGDAAQVAILTGSALVERSEGAVSVASTIHAAGDYSGSTTLQAILASPTGDEVRVRLWDASAASYVSNSTLTTNSTAPTIRTSSNLTLASAATIYELHMDMNGSGEDADSGLCAFAALRMQ